MVLKKKAVVEKLHHFVKDLRKHGGKVGKTVRVLELVYSNACNFRCEHCSTRAPLGENAETLMPMEKVASLADEAHALGVLEWHMHGGELLTNKPRLIELIKAIRPERFSVYLTSNGWLMTEDIAMELAEAGVDRVNISLDSMNPTVHDGFRGVHGAYERAIRALQYVKNSGMEAYVNITVGHFNAMSDDVEELCRFSYENGYHTFINVAVPCGNWQGNLDVVIDERDKERLMTLRQRYGNINRDIWNYFDKNNKAIFGCQAMNKLYITPSGDVLPCSFMHVKVGNVYKQTLKEIVDNGFKIKWFHNYSEKCLAGEDLDFIKQFMVDRPMSVLHPLEMSDLFSERDYVVGEGE